MHNPSVESSIKQSFLSLYYSTPKDLISSGLFVFKSLQLPVFRQVCQISFQNLPYALLDKGKIDPLLERTRFGEVCILSLASAVYHFVLQAVFSIPYLITCGKGKKWKEALEKQTVYTVLSLASFGVSLLGIISPRLGMQAGIKTSLYVGSIGARLEKGNLPQTIASLYRKYRDALRQGADARIEEIDKNVQPLFKKAVNDLLLSLDQELVDKKDVKTSDLYQLLKKVMKVGYTQLETFVPFLL